jgi:precorrin-6B methylase 2
MIGYYEPEAIIALGRLLKPGDVFLDVGAGEITICAAKHVGHAGIVYAFEPNTGPDCAIGKKMSRSIWRA